MFSKACEYGIKATLYIARRPAPDRRVSLKEIAGAIDSPEAFTGKILQQLARNGIIRSVKGPQGGFEIGEEDLDKLRLGHIVSAIDGNGIYKGCGLGLKECNEHRPCPVHNKFVVIRNELKEMLEQTSLRHLAEGLNGGLTFLKR